MSSAKKLWSSAAEVITKMLISVSAKRCLCDACSARRAGELSRALEIKFGCATRQFCAEKSTTLLVRPVSAK